MQANHKEDYIVILYGLSWSVCVQKSVFVAKKLFNPTAGISSGGTNLQNKYKPVKSRLVPKTMAA